MIDILLHFIAPHLCSGCGKVGTLLCNNCKYDITSEPYEQCLVCQTLTKRGICKTHRVAYSRAWCVGQRRDSLQRLIGNYKFQRVKAAYRPLARLLYDVLPDLPPNTVIVPVPTVTSHVRERGYDHIGLIAKEFSRLRSIPITSIVERSTKTTQRHAGRDQRLSQALKAFAVTEPPSANKTYLIIDDVVTTGATINHVAKLLKQSGATKVWVAAIARQPLD